MSIVSATMRAILVAGRLSGRPGRVVHACLSGFGLGLLSDDQLRELDELYYERDPVYRSETWNERGLSRWEQRALDENVVPGARVVVLAAGGGREVLALLRQGYDAIGYESHPALRDFGGAFLEHRGHPDRLFSVHRDRFPAVGHCDAVLVGWGAYSLISSRSRRARLLREAATAVRPGGAVILSAFARPAHGRDLAMTLQISRWLRRVRKRRTLELGDTLAPNLVHVFTAEQIESELRAGGIEMTSYRAVAEADDVTQYICAVGRAR
jgi:SAM-dependent methyltransferase